MRTALRLCLSILLAGALLALLFTWGDLSFEEFRATWRRLPAATYALALAIHVAIYSLRAARFRVLLPTAGRPDPARLLAVSAAHNLAALVLPAKSGEAALPVYLKRLCGVPASDGLASLVVSRLLDLAILCAFMAAACHWMVGGVDGAPTWLLPLALALTAASATAFAVAVRGDLLLAALGWLGRRTRLGETRVGVRLGEAGARVAASLRAAGGRASLLRATLLSLPLWLLVFAFLILLGRGFGLEQEHGLLGEVFGAACSLLAHMLPISPFAGVGTQEAGWMVGFGMLGTPDDLALSTGLGVYTVFRLNVVLLGALGHGAMTLLGRST